MFFEKITILISTAALRGLEVPTTHATAFKLLL
jgi:hypothetical protein